VRYLMPELPFPKEAAERWLPAVGFEGKYEVSDLGQVRSLDYLVPGTTPMGAWCLRRINGRVLKLTTGRRGYQQVRLGRSHMRYVHILVAEAFIGPCPPGMECCHGPRGVTDNRAVNLSWGTRAKNLGQDKERDGTDAHGDRAPMVKLTWEQVDEIRRRLPRGLRTGTRPKHLRHLPTQQDLADEYGVGRDAISKIVAGKSWRPEFRRDAS